MDMLVKAINLMVFLHRVDPIVKAESQLGTLYLLSQSQKGHFQDEKLKLYPTQITVSNLIKVVCHFRVHILYYI